MTEQELIEHIVARFKLVDEKILNKTTDRELLGSVKTDGYYRCDFSFKQPNGKTEWHGVAYHRLKFRLRWGYLPPLVDHKDGCKTNNVIGNLRASTKSLNQANRMKAPGCKVPFKGVTLTKQGKFRADCAGVYLGTFKEPADAARAYDQAARATFLDHACVNFPAHSGERRAI